MREGRVVPGSDGDGFRYWAFISYSHRDRRWGDWLHRALETYRVPARLTRQAGRDGALPRRIMPVFRDREELPTASNLGEAINQALKDSRYLIVICSPAAAHSIWVNEEVRSFKRMGRSDRIMCLVVDGEPNATDSGAPEREAFCPALRYTVAGDGTLTQIRTEPLAADVREIGTTFLASLLQPLLTRLDLRYRGYWLREARLKLIAGILGVDFDQLWQRERRRSFWRRVQATAVVVVMAAAAYGVWWKLAEAESLELASKALELIKDERNDEALKVLLNAVPRAPGTLLARPLLPEAQAALDLAMVRNRLKAILGGIRYETETIEMSADGALMATSSRDGTVRLWDTTAWKQTAFFYAFERLAGRDPAAGPKTDPERAGRPLAFHPARPILAAGTVDGRVMLFETSGRPHPAAVLLHSPGYADAKTETERRRFLIRSVSFDPAGNQLLSAGEDGTARLWDWQRGREQFSLKHPAPVKAARFEPFGRFIATVCDDGQTRLWDPATGAMLAQMPGGGGEFATLRFDANGKRLAIATNVRVLLWDVGDPRAPRLVRELQHEDAVRWIEFSPDNTLLATASDDGTARLWNAATGDEQARVEHRRSVRRALFDRAGKRFATVSEDRQVQVWDLMGKPLPGFALRGHTHFVLAGAFSRDGYHLVTASSDMTLRVWDMTPRARGVVLQGHKAPVRQALFLRGDVRVITTGLDRRVMLFDAQTGRRLDDDRFVDVHQDRINGLALSPEGDRFVTVSRDRTAKLWFFDPMRPPRTLARNPNDAIPQSHDDEVLSAAFSPDGKRIVTTSRDSTARLWDAATASPVPNVPPLRHTDGKPVWGAVFSHDGRLVLTAGHDERAGIWDAATGKNLHWLMPTEMRKAAINAAAFNAVSTLVATASDDGTVRLWDVASGRQIGTPLLHDDQVVSVAFHPVGDDLVSGSISGTLRFWRVSDHALLDIWYVHDGQAVRTIAFDRKGERMVTASDDRTAHVWPIQTDRSRLLQDAFATGRQICRRTPGTPAWSDVWRWCPPDLAE